ncbi:gastrula zinc finger protein XlCGF48.2-like [Hyperolius riggenbachi]|uniref:gastrula zinc finger protein XlCGF48.2-like n=1 Tax=Hyperolius riggenbachi TaxID=752182 RepID=UPI0035A39CB0
MEKDNRNLTKRLFGLTLEFIYLLTGEDYMVVKECGELISRRISHDVSFGMIDTHFAAAELKFLSHENKSDRKILKLSSKIIHLLAGEVRKFVGYVDSSNGDVTECPKPTSVQDGSGDKTPPESGADPLCSQRSAQEHHNALSHYKSKNLVGIKIDTSDKDVRGGDPCKKEINSGSEDTRMMPGEVKTEEQEEGHVRAKDEVIPPEISTAKSRKRNLSKRRPGLHLSWDSTRELQRIPQDYRVENDEVKVVVISHSEDEADETGMRMEDTDISESIEEQHGLNPDATSASPSSGAPPTWPSNQLVCQDEKINICTICGKSIPPSSSQPLTEAGTSSSEFCTCKKTSRYRPFCCVKCGKSFSSKLVYVAHQRVHLVDQYFPCGKCGMTFPSKSILESHQSIHTGERPFSCFLCGKCFAMKANLVKHLKTHRSEKPFSCQECGKNFRLKHLLLKHQQVHTGEKPFECGHCGKKFGVKFNLVMHERIHTGEKPFKCLECGKCFASRSNLTTHERVHTGEKPFTCTFCGKGFITTSDLSRHQKIHTDNGPFTCQECGNSFISKFVLNAHQKAHSKKTVVISEPVVEGLDNC